jgi:hypothetical protein
LQDADLVESLLLLVVFLVVLLLVVFLGRLWRVLRNWPLGRTRRGLDVALLRTRCFGRTIIGSYRRLNLLLGRSLRPHLLLLWLRLRAWCFGRTIARSRRRLNIALLRTRRFDRTVVRSYRRLNLLLRRSLRPRLLLLWLWLRAWYFRRPVIRTRRGLHVALRLWPNRLRWPVERTRRGGIVLLLLRLTYRRR